MKLSTRNPNSLTCFVEHSVMTGKFTAVAFMPLLILRNKLLNMNRCYQLNSNKMKLNRTLPQLPVAYTPQQNGVAERMNRTIMDLIRSMIHTSGMDKKFWAEAAQTAVYVRNRVTSRSLPKLKTPFHLWHNAVPDLSHLRIFASPCFYTIPKNKRKKLNPRSREAIFMGYSMQSNPIQEKPRSNFHWG